MANTSNDLMRVLRALGVETSALFVHDIPMILVIPIPFIVITTIIPFWNTTVILNITMIMMILVWSVSLSLQTIVLYYIGVSIVVFIGWTHPSFFHLFPCGEYPECLRSQQLKSDLQQFEPRSNMDWGASCWVHVG